MAAAIPDVDSLSLDEQIGQLLCFGWQGAAPEESRAINGHAREIVREMRVGSVVLLGRNAGPPQPARALMAELQSLAEVPLFVAVDQEGGRINRFRSPFHRFPGNDALGRAAERAGMAAAESLTYRQAAAQARELRAVGINWNFAPCVDVNNNPANPVIGRRSYGADPQIVSRLGAAAVRGLQEHGVLACAKHFPGHGDTTVDSHHALPVITVGRKRLDEVELPPFRAAIAAGAGAVMSTHILFPALDPERPATLSPAILTGLLRHELGFEGVIITDCLEMNAISKGVGSAAGAVHALRAGADVALICHTRSIQREAVAAIREAVLKGGLPRERVRESCARVLNAKRQFVTQGFDDDPEPWLSPAAGELEREVADAAGIDWPAA